MMTVGLRKLALTAHVTSSVGWFGAVAAFLALAIVGLTSPDPPVVRAAYLAMHLVTWFVIVPMSLAALLTGLIQSLGTTWGLFRHYWIVTKLLLTCLATIILLIHTQPIDRIAAVATVRALSSGELWQLRLQLVGDASAAMFVLFATTMMSVYKPWGLTPYGIRKQYESPATAVRELQGERLVRERRMGGYVVLAIIGFVVLVVLLHLAGGGLHGH